MIELPILFRQATKEQSIPVGTREIRKTVNSPFHHVRALFASLALFDRRTVQRDLARLKTHRRAITAGYFPFLTVIADNVTLSLSSQGVPRLSQLYLAPLPS